MTFPKKLFYCLTIVAFGSLVSLPSRSQDPHPAPKHPGNVVNYEVKFIGDDADKIKYVRAMVVLIGETKPDQPGFSTSQQGDDVEKSSVDGHFHPSIKLTDLVATGEYRLVIIGYTERHEVQVSYGDPEDLVPKMRIVNDSTFHKPRIEVEQKP